MIYRSGINSGRGGIWMWKPSSLLIHIPPCRWLRKSHLWAYMYQKITFNIKMTFFSLLVMQNMFLKRYSATLQCRNTTWDSKSVFFFSLHMIKITIMLTLSLAFVRKTGLFTRHTSKFGVLWSVLIIEIFRKINCLVFLYHLFLLILFFRP